MCHYCVILCWSLVSLGMRGLSARSDWIVNEKGNGAGRRPPVHLAFRRSAELQVVFDGLP